MIFKQRPRFVSWEFLSSLEHPPRVNITSLDDLYLKAVLEGSYSPLPFSESSKWILAAKLILAKTSNQPPGVFNWAEDIEVAAIDEPDPTPPKGGERALPTPPPGTDSDVSGSIYRSFISDVA